jgi:hypothetical protein
MNEIKIIRTDRADTKEIELSLSEAKKKLTPYWEIDKIEELLLSGEELYTPYAYYKLK